MLFNLGQVKERCSFVDGPFAGTHLRQGVVLALLVSDLPLGAQPVMVVLPGRSLKVQPGESVEVDRDTAVSLIRSPWWETDADLPELTETSADDESTDPGTAGEEE